MKDARRGVLAAVSMVVIGAGLLLVGQLARRTLAAREPPPGRLVDIGGRRLHLDCRGDGPVTILLEAGLNDFSVQWSRVHPALAQVTRACVYDRAGLGFSDPSPRPPTLAHAIADLEALLAAAELEDPLLLVGHSYGGVLVRAFGKRHPARVMGLVLVDPAHEAQLARMPALTPALADIAEQFDGLARLSALGVLALVSKSIPVGRLEGTAAEHYRAALATGSFFGAAAAETRAFRDNLRAFAELSVMPEAKLAVAMLSRGRPEAWLGLSEEQALLHEQAWAGLQREIAAKVVATPHVVVSASGHAIPLEAPEQVIEVTRGLLERNAGWGRARPHPRG